MPRSLLSDYSAGEITGEVLLYETRAGFLTALGSCHWTKSNKPPPTQRHVTARWQTVDREKKRKERRIINVCKIRKNPSR